MSKNPYLNGGLYNVDIGGSDFTPIPPAVPGFFELEGGGIFLLENGSGFWQLETVISNNKKPRIKVKVIK